MAGEEDTKAKQAKDSKEPAGGAGKAPEKKGKDEEPELTEEELQKKEDVELLVTRLQDESAEIAKTALTALIEEIRTSTGSMTAVPLPLKFLRPHYETLKEFYQTMTVEENKVMLGRVLSLMATSVANTERLALKYTLECGSAYLEAWGHEYVRNLAGELVEEWSVRQEEEKPAEDLLKLVGDLVKYNMAHNAEPEGCDVLLELEQISRIHEFVDSANFSRICLYLLSSATYAGEQEDLEILRNVLLIYKNQKQWSSALVLAIKLNDMDEITTIFNTCEDGALKKQLALILGRQHVYIECEDETLAELIGNVRLPAWFKKLAQDLDVLEPKEPEDIYKTHLLDSRFAQNLEKQVDSAKQNLAATFVNAFVNCGFGTDKLMTIPDSKWLYKNKDSGQLSTAASLGLLHLWDAEEGPSHLDKYVYTGDSNIKAGALLGTGIVSSGIHTEHDLALGILTDYATEENETVRAGAILGLGIAYAGTGRDDVAELLTPVLEETTSLYIAGMTCLALGLIYVSSCNDDVSESMLNFLLMQDEEALKSTHTRFVCLGLGLLYLGKQADADVAIEALPAIPGPTAKYAHWTVLTLAYAGTGNVLQVQQLLHACGEHLEEDNEYQAVCVLGLALIGMGDEIGAEMCVRAFDHLLQYGDPVIRRAVPLALGLLSPSNPQLLIVDTLSKLSHDTDLHVAQAAILGMGMVGAGTNNSRIAGLLRQLSAYYSKDAQPLFMIRVAQGLLHLGKGTMTLNPFHTHDLLLGRTALAGLATVAHACLDFDDLIHGAHHYLLYMFTPAIYPRMLLTVDEDMEPLEVSVRVGQAVDTVGQAGKPKTITGFQTHSTPVLIGRGERAELATEEYLPMSNYLESMVILKKNPDFNTE